MDEKQAETTEQIRKILEEKKMAAKQNAPASEEPAQAENEPFFEEPATKETIQPEQNAQPKQSGNSGVYISFALLVICVAAISYFLGTLNKASASNMPKAEKPASFEELPGQIKEKYILKSVHEEQVAKLKEAATESSGDENVLINRRELASSKNYNIFKCYDENVGDYNFSKGCRERIGEFLNANASARAYEVIGVVDDEDEAKYLRAISDKELTQYALKGLSRKRVVEASWKIKEALGKDVNLVPVNYTITSKVSRGFVIRAHK